MKYYKELYVGESLQKKKEKILRKLAGNKLLPNVYVIAFARNAHNQLEFYPSALLLQKVFRADNLFVVGIAKGYDEAVSVIADILNEVYEETGTGNIRDYLVQRQTELEEREV